MKISILLLAVAVMLSSCSSEKSAKQDETPDTSSTEAVFDTEDTSNTDDDYEDKGDFSMVDVLYNAVVDSMEFPIMVPVMDELLPDYIGELSNVDSYLVQQAGITSIFVYIIVVKAVDGKVDEVYGAVEDFQKNLKDEAFYPQGYEAAKASILGKSGDIVYLLCHEQAKELEKTLLEAKENAEQA